MIANSVNPSFRRALASILLLTLQSIRIDGGNTDVRRRPESPLVLLFVQKYLQQIIEKTPSQSRRFDA